MKSTNAIRRKVDVLQKQAEEIEELGIKLLIGTDFVTSNPLNYLSKPNFGIPLRTIQHEVIIKYQQWYSTVLMMVREYIPEWRDVFEAYYSPSSSSHMQGYNGVMDYLRLNKYTIYKTIEDILNDFTSDLERQLSILLSILSVVEVKEMSLRELISADVSSTRKTEH